MGPRCTHVSDRSKDATRGQNVKGQDCCSWLTYGHNRAFLVSKPAEEGAQLIFICAGRQCYSDILKQSQYYRTLDVFNTDVKGSGPNACRLLRLIPDAGACSALSHRCLEILQDTLMVIVHACTRLEVRERQKLVTVTCWSHAGFPRRKASLALPSLAPCQQESLVQDHRGAVRCSHVVIMGRLAPHSVKRVSDPREREKNTLHLFQLATRHAIAQSSL